jgi:hypothetical protein
VKWEVKWEVMISSELEGAAEQLRDEAAERLSTECVCLCLWYFQPAHTQEEKGDDEVMSVPGLWMTKIE